VALDHSFRIAQPEAANFMHRDRRGGHHKTHHAETDRGAERRNIERRGAQDGAEWTPGCIVEVNHDRYLPVELKDNDRDDHDGADEHE
jgi:hypothetical protein